MSFQISNQVLNLIQNTNFVNRSKYYCIIEKIFNSIHIQNKDIYLEFINKILYYYSNNIIQHNNDFHRFLNSLYKFVKNRCGRINEYKYKDINDLEHKTAMRSILLSYANFVFYA